MQVVLVMFRADGERRSFSIVRDMTVVGRREDCDLRIPLGEVSRKHCRIMKEGESIRLEDLGSSNGTFHNGQRVRDATLSAGDTVQIGPVTFMVQIDGVPADEDMHPATAADAAVPQGSDDFFPVDEPAQAQAPAAEAGEAATPAAAEDDIDFDLPAEDAQPPAEGGDAVDFDFDEEPSPSNESSGSASDK
ncbi:MAG TPA: FHA domain-containing protein [Tepidisphaeraceae bacterium]|jgi:pSer/pThr/pTyr-binding forkhead associated (FHA) protein|nr:FHA domain-containing protein [Tepidisphaeraceae bacterium]